MEKEIIKLSKDVEHVKDSTEEIKLGVAALVASARENHDEILKIRERVRVLERESCDAKSAIKDVRLLLWRISGILGITGGGAISALEFFGK